MTPTATSPTATSLAPTAARLWQRSRGLLAAALVLLIGGLLYAALSGSTRYPALDPRSTAPDGSRALARLLEQQGVTVDTAAPGQALDDGHPVTVLLPGPDVLTPDQSQALDRAVHAHGGRVVLIAPGRDELDALAPGVRPVTSGGRTLTVPSASAAPGCSLPEAARAGSAELGGALYQVSGPAQGCYLRYGRPTLVDSRRPSSGDTVVLGSGRFLTNDRLDDDGNAALALGLLGAHQRLVWYLPDYDHSAATGEGDRTLVDLLPAGWRWGLLQAGVAALLAAAWRARRLGPVVPENLPVVVRAAETTEGRARLYRRARARDRAADALRRAARARLAATLGLPARPEADPAALTAAVAARLPGDRTPAEPQALLYGAAPADDAALLRLADDLDTLERQVRQP
ncbi:DUF4350 domain-containing protein [Streptomyces sp. NPDC092296]|uniref:DUF4350 domain-containing protein n=1 Tax=Streptomyces sp. NPDC092296 TaxID=3366012 RepID=UPI0037F8BA3D